MIDPDSDLRILSAGATYLNKKIHVLRDPQV